MAFVDHTAANEIRDMREGRGYNSPEALADAIKATSLTAEWGPRGTVDAWTIRRVEEGHVPGPRIRFVIASYFGKEPGEIWQSRNWKPVAKSVALAVRKVPA